MELIERYIYAVTQRLPLDQREDVADELRASIEDALEEKGSHSKKDVTKVLTELGSPAILANRYKGGSQYLIGPAMYPYYIETLKMVYSIGMPIVFFIALIAQIIQSHDTIGAFIAGLISILVGAAIQMLFWTSAVFVIFERTNVSEKDLTSEHPWTPDMLPEVKTGRQIPVSEPVGDIIWFTFLALVPFLAQPFIGAHIDGQTTPFFNSEIGTVWAVAAVVFGVVGILKALLKLRLRNWTPALTVFNVIFSVAFSAALIALPLLTTVVNPAFVSLMDAHITTSDLAEVTQFINWTVWISIGVAVSIDLYDAFNSIRLSRKLVK